MEVSRAALNSNRFLATSTLNVISNEHFDLVCLYHPMR